jgi:hypothetical protein
MLAPANSTVYAGADMSAYLSARASADYCGVSEKTIRNWIASGRLRNVPCAQRSTRVSSASTVRRGQPELQPATVSLIGDRSIGNVPQWRRMWPLALGLVYVVLSIALLAWPR